MQISIQFTEIAQMVLIVALVAGLGLIIGKINFKGISLGIAGALFTGIGFGHLGFTLTAEVLEFLREFGLILFVYTIGIQIGPSFFSSLKEQGLKLNFLAFVVVTLGALIAVTYVLVFQMDLPIALGIFSGGTTNTPSLGAGTQILRDVLGSHHPSTAQPALAYAVAYPYGILGIIITMLFLRTLFKVDVATAVTQFQKSKELSQKKFMTISVRVTHGDYINKTILEIERAFENRIRVTRILHAGGSVTLADGRERLAIDDEILLFGEESKLLPIIDKLGMIGEAQNLLTSLTVAKRRVLLSNSKLSGRSIEGVKEISGPDIIVTRVERGEVEFMPTSSTRIQFGDTLTLVAHPKTLDQAEVKLGNNRHLISHPQILPIFIGIAFGVLLGSIAMPIPGLPVPVKLGLAGGPLLVALILGRVGSIPGLVFRLPMASNLVLREIGITLFLACVGLKAGPSFMKTVIEGDGLLWIFYGAFLTTLPILLVGFLAMKFFKENYLSVCGLLAGSMTDPPALAFANALAPSEASAVVYATVYPLVMMLRILYAQLLVLFLI